MKLLFIVNPISGGVNKEPFLKKAVSLCNKYGIEYHIFKTSGKDDHNKLKAIIESFGPDKIASVGGDGTTLFSAVSLLGYKIPMGIIPLGSANGMATELYVNSDPVEALKDIIMSDITGELDMVLVNDKYYSIHIGDVGINARIVEAYEKDSNRGMGTYARYFIEELKTIKAFSFTIEADGKSTETEGVMLGICNSRKYGTGVPLNLEGNPMDGKFEIVAVKRIDTNLLIKAGLSKFNENFLESQNSTVISTNRAKISFDRPRLLQLDGEIIGSFKELKIEIIKGAVSLISHKGNKYLQASSEIKS